MPDRDTAIAAFLDRAGWGGASRSAIAGDASQRRYERLVKFDRTAILMDAPAGQTDDPADFLRIGLHLCGIGLNAPEVFHADLAQGFLLLQDFGDATFARVIAQSPGRQQAMYELAGDVLVHLQSQPAPPGLRNLSADDWATAAMVALDWYRFAIVGDRVGVADLRGLLAEAMAAHADGPRVLILRDYHAENLMWVAGEKGLARAGLLDFQLAQMGQPGYDLVSLLQDARRDVPFETEAACMARFCAATGTGQHDFHRAYAILGTQRALRILGMFARLCLIDGKAQYLVHLPRVWGQLQRNLAASGLAPLAELCQRLLPAPDAPNLDRIARQCAQHVPH